MPALAELREKHPRFIYESFSLDRKDAKLRVSFRFTLEPNIVFTPEIVLPAGQELKKQQLENFAFHLGLIETISYWKAACSPKLLIEAGKLSDEQISWWHNLYIHGLGELFYQNDIDFTSKNFLSIESASNNGVVSPKQCPPLSGDLVLVGGGKDSAVTLEILKDSQKRKGTLMLNPTRASLDNAHIAGYENPLIVSRTIDPTLLKLNRQGYINGHTPFSAYLAFLGIFVGALHDYKNVIVSNERSSGEGNVVFHGLEINHQYSKSYHFEKLFREYCVKYLTGNTQYFSILRPLYDLQISHLFAQYPEQYLSFRSCNVNQREDSWCGSCAKCAFVYLSLSPFIPYARMMDIFGQDYYDKPEIEPFVRELVGLGAHKPFECVGTEEESRLAIALSTQHYRSAGRKIPPLLLSLEKELGLTNNTTIQILEQKVTNKWGGDHFLPPDYERLLKETIAKIR